MKYIKLLTSILFIGILIILVFLFNRSGSKSSSMAKEFWEMQSIDTVKYSRDVAREKENDSSYDQTIEAQVSLIAGTGATHVAIGTPYDQEFVPFLTRWVAAARRHNLNVWFRGNFSGWEGWFGYTGVSREEHLELLKKFILNNGELFENGDIFTSCTECENGGPGDPRATGDVDGHREFLIDEYKMANESFRFIGKNVRANFFPMNGDVARLIMDKETTRALGGTIVVDHYVESTDRLYQDLKALAEQGGGRVVLGEFGAPIPDIHGEFNQREQAEWIEDALAKLSEMPELAGVNYWTSFGSSTELWNANGTPRLAVDVIAKYYSPVMIWGRVLDGGGQPIRDAQIVFGSRSERSDKSGRYFFPTVNTTNFVEVAAEGYHELEVELSPGEEQIVSLDRKDESLLFRLKKAIHRISKK